MSIQNCPFHCENFMYQHNLRWFYTDRVSCNTNKAIRSKLDKEFNFQFGGHELL